MRRFAVLALALLALSLAAASPAAASPPPIKHVFVIVLENKGFDETFGPSSPAPYLSKQLTAQGELLSQYYGIGHASLDNYIAMVSGQAPAIDTQADCQFYSDLLPGTLLADGQAFGEGCVYPAAAKTVADQLAAKGLSWRGYMEDMASNCLHPAPNSFDQTQTATAASQYAARHNPFVYFHSLLDSGACAANDVPLGQLDSDLASASTTPNFAFVTPDLCNDGHDATCADGGPGGLPAADAFLQTWVPKITGSPAWAEGSLLIVTFDEAESGDASSCCGEMPGPNSPNPGGTSQGSGGGRVGAVLLSRFVRPGSTNPTPYNHYSLLASIEDVFGLSRLADAGQAGLQAFGPDVYNAPGLATASARGGSLSRPGSRARRAHRQS
jgi:phosphatidylinositol-3-phosphatase